MTLLFPLVRTSGELWAIRNLPGEPKDVDKDDDDKDDDDDGFKGVSSAISRPFDGEVSLDPGGDGGDNTGIGRSCKDGVRRCDSGRTGDEKERDLEGVIIGFGSSSSPPSEFMGAGDEGSSRRLLEILSDPA